MSLEDKILHSQSIIKEITRKNIKSGIACSFGKDSMVVVHLTRSIDSSVPIFSVMTKYKPKETFDYLVSMYQSLDLEPFVVYYVGEKIPDVLNNAGITVKLLPSRNFKRASDKIQDRRLYEVNPDLCCKLLKVEPTKEAVKDLDAWICGLRNTEGRTRKNYQSIEKEDGLIKINPILEFTEMDVLNYLKLNNIKLHPWYLKKFPDGKRYRSLGCEVCTVPIHDNQLERDGRWIETSKCGGECGIHTQKLK